LIIKDTYHGEERVRGYIDDSEIISIYSGRVQMVSMLPPDLEKARRYASVMSEAIEEYNLLISKRRKVP